MLGTLGCRLSYARVTATLGKSVRRRRVLVALAATIAATSALVGSSSTASAATFHGCSWNHILPHVVPGSPAKVVSGVRVTCAKKHFLRSQIRLFQWTGSAWKDVMVRTAPGARAKKHVNRASAPCAPGWWVSWVWLRVNDHVTKAYSKQVFIQSC